MDKKFSRRSFMTTSLMGVGGLALASPRSTNIEFSNIKSSKGRSEILMATTGYTDNIFINHRGSRYGDQIERSPEYYQEHKSFMNRAQLDELHKFLSSIGVTRHNWIVDTYWSLYDSYPHGFDFLAEAVDSAHAHGIEFFAVIKPFEGGGFGKILPHSMPFPKGVQALKDIRGIFPRAQSFVAQNPQFCLKRRPGTYEANEEISTIRLIKSDEHPTRIKSEHLTLWISQSNNKFVEYNGPVSFRESVEWRFHFSRWKKSRILHFEGLKIPKGHKYILIKCSYADRDGDFSNEKGNILELVAKDGKVLPHTLSTGPVGLDEHEGFYKSKVLKKNNSLFAVA